MKPELATPRFRVNTNNNASLFHALILTVLGPLVDVWTLNLSALCSNSFSRFRQMLMHKNMHNIPIVFNIFSNAMTNSYSEILK